MAIIKAKFVQLFFLLQENLPAVEMADKLRENGKIFVVVAIAFIILIGVFIYLISLDRKISKLEEKLNNN